MHLVAAVDPDNVMPMKGTKWTPEQVGAAARVDRPGRNWDASVTFAQPEPLNLRPRPVALPPGTEPHPVDRSIAAYFAAEGRRAAGGRRRPRLRAARLPRRDRPAADGRAARGVRRRHSHRTSARSSSGSCSPTTPNYADHWLTFWNDLLRNDYKGTGYIDGGRKQITGWLYTALLTNKPYDQFVAELVNPTPASEGFTKGIIWRGSVNASMTPPMQAAQSVSQVFLGVNLKCAGCHDSFVSDWTLDDAYGLAAVYSDKPLEMVHCDKPTGQDRAAASSSTRRSARSTRSCPRPSGSSASPSS